MTPSHGTTVLPFGAFYGQSETRRQAHGIELAIMNADPHRIVERHTHEDAHFVFVLDGLYVSTATGAPSVCHLPTLIFNPAGTTHRDHFEARSTLFEGRFLTLSVAPNVPHLLAFGNGLPERATLLDQPASLALAQSITRECATWNPGALLQIEDHAAALLSASASRAREPHERRPPRWLQSARDMLHDRCADTLHVADLAEAAGVHPVHLARVFRHHLGCSPGEYLRHQRLGRARVLLRETTRALSDIALSCGFVDQSHFAKTFKAHVGVTPGTFRKDSLR
ncbi:MAG: helix-turn-helix transcriptional regulator [bacterium]